MVLYRSLKVLQQTVTIRISIRRGGKGVVATCSKCHQERTTQLRWVRTRCFGDMDPLQELGQEVVEPPSEDGSGTWAHGGPGRIALLSGAFSWGLAEVTS